MGPHSSTPFFRSTRTSEWVASDRTGSSYLEKTRDALVQVSAKSRQGTVQMAP